ncbi:MAG: hypothetical protein PPP58_09285 [Natronomonas sp.]
MKRRALLKKAGVGGAAGGVILGNYSIFEELGNITSFYVGTLEDGSTDELPSKRLANGYRNVTGETYLLSYEWIDPARNCWEVSYSVDHDDYVAAVDRTEGYFNAFETARSSDRARQIGIRLKAARPVCGGDVTVDDAARFRQVVGFVQSFEYEVDSVSTGLPEYHRTIEETLVEGVGDCKDLTYLLAGLLSQPPFEYRTAMVFMPEHMLVGVHRDDLAAAYAEFDTVADTAYVPVETTARREIGYLQSGPILAVYDGDFVYYDGEATARETGRRIKNPSESEFIDSLT